MTPSTPLRRALLRTAAALALAVLAGGAASAQTINLSASSNQIPEGGSTTVTATRTGSMANAVTVTLRFASGSTFQGGEVNIESTTLTIPAGATTASTSVTATEDDDTVDETAVVEIATVSPGSIGSSRSVTLTVADNDVARVTLQVADTQINEGGQTTITARRSRTTGEAVSVRLSTTGDTDAFSVNPLTIVIPAGSATGTATLFAGEDTDTTDETVTVSIAEVTGGGAVADGAQTRTVTIRDNDGGTTPFVTLSASRTTIDENGGVSTLTIKLTRRASAATTVSLALGGEDDDVTLSQSTVTIPADQTEATVTLTARNDANFNDETVTVDVTDVSGSNARERDTQQVTVRVTDDDTPGVTLSVTPLTTINEGQETMIRVALPAGARANGPVTVRLAYSIDDGDDDDRDTADRSDFEAPNEIVIPAGQNAAMDTLRAVADDIFEADAVVTVSIDRVSGRAMEAGEQTATVTITSDDVRPTVTLDASPNTIAARGGTSQLTARLSNRSDEVVAVGLSYFGSAGRGTDYTAPDTVYVQPGQLTGSAPLVSTGGGSGNQVVIDVTGVRNGTESGTQQEFVSFSEGLNRTQVSFADASATVREDAGSYTVRLTLSETLASPATVAVVLTGTTGGGAASDLGGFSRAEVRIPTGTRTASVTIPVTDDELREGVETFTFSLSTTDGDRVQTSGTFTLTVTDDDAETAFVINEIDGIVTRRDAQFVELFSAGGAGSADGLSLAVFGADSTVATVVRLDGLSADADGYLVVCDTASDDDACDIEAPGFPSVVAGAALVRGDGARRGDAYDDVAEDAIDAAIFDERAAALERATADRVDLDAEDGSLQRQDSGKYAFVAPPTPGDENNVGIAVPTTPQPVVLSVGDVFPNPSSGAASLDVSVAEAQRVRVSVYDALGRQVATAFDGVLRPGAAVRVAVGGALAPGVYVVRVAGETFAEARRLTVAR